MRTLLWLVGKSLRQHALSSTVTVLVCAIASGLVLSVFSLEKQAREAFTGDVGFDAVLGARGSELQLVLNAIFHLDTSPGNIPWSMYREIASRPGVELAVPYALGDNYAGFRIAGTTKELFEKYAFGNGRERKLELEPGNTLFDETRAEAVIGATVARATGMVRGSKFQPIHGVASNGNAHDITYVVTGVLQPTGTPMDRVIFVPIEGIFRMDGHVLRGSGSDYVPSPTEEIPDEAKEVSAVLLRFSNAQRAFFLKEEVNRQGDRATLAWPIRTVMQEIFDKLGWMVRVLQGVAWLVVVSGSLSILAALWNTMNERRREFAILRALGARRGTVFSAIVCEATAIAVVGCLVGYVIYGVVGFAVAAVLREQVGVHLEVFSWQPVFGWILPGALVLGALAGLLPAARAYSTEVAKNLLPVS
ncbi:MAG: FtsX-like permease family protein [Planctomycetota bacterium]